MKQIIKPPVLHVVLVSPEIPQNTGSIARTCAATKISLHLIHPLGFQIDEKKVKRAGLDYWPWVHLTEHQTFDDFIASTNPNQIWLFTKFADKYHHEANFSKGDALVFGSETKGLGKEFLGKYPNSNHLRIPMFEENVRSLNLSNAVSVGVYEGIRQIVGTNKSI